MIVFLVARYVAHDWARRKSGERMRRLMENASREGFRFVLFMRLAGFPYFVMNYLLGVTQVKFSHFAVATYLGLAPTMTAVTYAGSAGFDALTGGDNPVRKVALAIRLSPRNGMSPVRSS